jgi:hypothetical protein
VLPFSSDFPTLAHYRRNTKVYLRLRRSGQARNKITASRDTLSMWSVRLLSDEQSDRGPAQERTVDDRLGLGIQQPLGHA